MFFETTDNLKDDLDLYRSKSSFKFPCKGKTIRILFGQIKGHTHFFHLFLAHAVGFKSHIFGSDIN